MSGSASSIVCGQSKTKGPASKIIESLIPLVHFGVPQNRNYHVGDIIICYVEIQNAGNKNTIFLKAACPRSSRFH